MKKKKKGRQHISVDWPVIQNILENARKKKKSVVISRTTDTGIDFIRLIFVNSMWRMT